MVVDGRGRPDRALLELPASRLRTAGASADELGEELIERLEEAVRLRLMSDVPLGAMLSGGLDSSLIVALMARNMSEPVKTFSVGFVEDGERERAADAKLVAEASAPTITSSSSLRVSTVDLEEPRLADGRADRRPLLARLPGALGARRPARDGRALGAGRRRAARRLPQAPGRLARRALATAAGAAPAASARRTRRLARAPRPCARCSPTARSTVCSP